MYSKAPYLLRETDTHQMRVLQSLSLSLREAHKKDQISHFSYKILESQNAERSSRGGTHVIKINSYVPERYTHKQ